MVEPAFYKIADALRNLVSLYLLLHLTGPHLRIRNHLRHTNAQLSILIR